MRAAFIVVSLAASLGLSKALPAYFLSSNPTFGCFAPVGGPTMASPGTVDGASETTLTFAPALRANYSQSVSHYTFAYGQAYAVTVSSSMSFSQSMFGANGGTFDNPGGWSACPGVTTVDSVPATGYYLGQSGDFTFTWTAPSTAITVSLGVSRAASSAGAIYTTQIDILCPSCSPAAPTTPTPTASPTTPAPVSAGAYDADLCTVASEWGIYSTSGEPNTKLCWKVVGDMLEVALEAPTGNWAAFGISETQKGMVGLDAYFFLATGGAGSLQNRNAAGTRMPVLDTSTPTYREVVSIASSPTDASRQLVFRRPLTASGNRLDASANLFTLFATGPVSASGDPQYHTFKSYGSSVALATVGAVEVTIVKFATGLKQAHGTCMILAWIFLCPTAIIDARAAKGVLTQGGWFKLHRNCQILAVTLTILGYIFIKSDDSVLIDDKSSDTKQLHQLIGMVVVGLSIFQICLGLLRNVISGASKEGYDKEKHPHGPRRIIFNVLHILTGIVLVFLSWNNVMTGTYIDCGTDEQCEDMEGWVKSPVQKVIAAGTWFTLIAYVCMGALQLAKSKGYVSSKTIVDVVGRHVLAHVAAMTFAAAVTAITILYDSNDV